MSMNRPSKEEIVKGVLLFLKEDLAPKLKGDLRFPVLIGASLLEIVLREMTLDPHAFMKPGALDNLLGPEARKDASPEEKEATLCEMIREGVFDQGEARQALVGYLSDEVCYKIQVDNPKW
jgi:hypothetical protein